VIKAELWLPGDHNSALITVSPAARRVSGVSDSSGLR
jgi:hypothetical protein